MGRQGADGLPLGHRRAPRGAGDDHRLAHLRQGVLRPQGRRRAAEGAHPRTHVVGDPQRLQPVELLPHGAVDAGVARVQPHRHPALRLGGTDHLHHLLQRHLRTVVYLTARAGVRQQGRVHQAPGVNHHVRLPQQTRAPDRDQIRRSAAGSYEMYHDCDLQMVG